MDININIGWEYMVLSHIKNVNSQRFCSRINLFYYFD